MPTLHDSATGQDEASALSTVGSAKSPPSAVAARSDAVMVEAESYGAGYKGCTYSLDGNISLSNQARASASYMAGYSDAMWGLEYGTSYPYSDGPSSSGTS